MELDQNGYSKECISTIRFYSAPIISKKIIEYGEKIKNEQYMRLKEIKFTIKIEKYEIVYFL